jgi:asparagine synthase (glutamine-hydrolysing)
MGSDAEAIEQLDKLLRKSVGSRMVADVPLGAFLSGGFDSTMVVAQMQAQCSQSVKTFSIGFYEEGYNEAKHAKAIANHLETDHTELYVSSEKAMAVIPQLPMLYDEPFSDSSQIPTYLISEMTRKHVTVSLSGDGGDELFCGYNRYFLGQSIWNKIGWMPDYMKVAVSRFILTIPKDILDKGFKWLKPLFLKYGRPGKAGDKLYKLAEVLAMNSPEATYHSLVSDWKNPEAILLAAHEPLTALTDYIQWADLSNFIQRMMFLDLITYLPDDILTKVDRASMGVSLEARVPMLDHKVVEFAWRMPLSMKVRNGQGKWLLRQVLYKYVPRELIERPKMGFGIPIDSWLRGPLRDWAEELLDESRLRQEGFFNPAPIRQKWAEHLSGKRNWAYHLWDVLMVQGWLESTK